MVDFKIPESFKETLDQNFALSGVVMSAIAEFGVWLEQNNIKFFTEYTDHSLRHVEAVLKTADDLVRDECRGIITPPDVATLTLAVLLHDAAMHLSIDSFISLVQDEGEKLIVSGWGDKPWAKLWQDFLAEARRFSGRKLMALFGNTDPIGYPPMDSQRMTGRDLLLIGEFLRRHHTRLAHEIAVYGVPGPKGRELKLTRTPETEHIIDLAGMVARSHGLSIRDSYDYLQANYSSRKQVRGGVHPVFLMALLRIADVLQLQSDRAPRQVRQVSELCSPVSAGEWDMHQAIKDMNTHEYPETIFIDARPNDVKTYLRIRKMLDQIQQELDTSWTAIGEVYGDDPQFRAFGLKIRRVRSNLDNLEEFSKQVQYIPTDAAFVVADTDLLKLLIGPLYGNDPTIGIRELVQNALDAVRELQEYQKPRLNLKDIDLTPQEGDIVVAVEKDQDGRGWVTVSDRGIGMTVETVRDYFLKAGASFRRSDLWRKTFEDAEGKSRVLRSGRFGVGALATFLLGDEIYVSTRHVDALRDEGIEFSAQLDSESIELRRISRPVGTTVRIRISENTMEKLEPNKVDPQGRRWDRYCLSKPRLVRKMESGNHQAELNQALTCPEPSSMLPIGWHRINHPDFAEIHWTYHEFPSLSELVCNGIYVTSTEGENWDRELWRGSDMSLSRPLVSVFDFDGRLPLNLARTGLIESAPFDIELLEDVARDFVAFLLVNAPSTIPGPLSEWHDYIEDYPGIQTQHVGFLIERPIYNWPSSFHTSSGTGPANDPWSLHQLPGRASLFIPCFETPMREQWSSRLSLFPPIAPGSSEALFRVVLPCPSDDRARADLLAPLLRQPFPRDGREEYFVRPRKPFSFWEVFFTPAERIMIGRNVLDLLVAYSESRFGNAKVLRDELTSWAKVEWEDENWVLLKTEDCPSPIFDFLGFASENPLSDLMQWPCIINERYFKEPMPEVDLTPIGKALREILGSPIIPYDFQERHEKFAEAYTELEPYIKAQEEWKGSAPERRKRRQQEWEKRWGKPTKT